MSPDNTVRVVGFRSSIVPIPVMAVQAPITVIIPTSGTSRVIEPLLDDLEAQTIKPELVHVIVNNHASEVNRFLSFRRPKTTVSILSPRHYFTKGVNVALREASTRYVAIVNDDIRLTHTWVETAGTALDLHPQYGSLASRVLSLRFPGLIDSCGDSLYTSGQATNNGWHEPATLWKEPEEVFAASGCLAVYHTADVVRAGFLDEDYVAYMEDVDLGFRLQLLGRPCLYWPAAEASHIGGATRRSATGAARLVERNTLITLLKNFPTSLLRGALRDISIGHLRPCSFEGHRSLTAWSWGKLSAAGHMSRTLKKRRYIQASRAVSDAYVRSILKQGSPPICHL